MIKIINTTYIKEHTIKLEFSNNSFTIYDFSYLLLKNSKLTSDLKNQEYFKSYFLELGAICWKNGLELSPDSLYQKAKELNNLSVSKSVA